jgi:hypothetical protein
VRAASRPDPVSAFKAASSSLKSLVFEPIFGCEFCAHRLRRLADPEADGQVVLVYRSFQVLAQLAYRLISAGFSLLSEMNIHDWQKALFLI